MINLSSESINVLPKEKVSSWFTCTLPIQDQCDLRSTLLNFGLRFSKNARIPSVQS